ncbi:carbon monoxide dehydrogenase subunit G [Pararhodobacter sp. SW119]|uniref:CoxG family protein n=1 Tax=Pararhodobacter sp. SW119 TaxID=2780075 RepID=UPI001AE05AE1|nr:carbon monoxide dehydrogenase subunit G [Pararhodobacter sp. SW119]
MQMSDERRIDAPPEVVWAALLDPEVLKASVPGCEELTGSAEEGFEAVVVQKVGPVRAKFNGTVTVADMVEGESLTLTGEGKGGAAGFAKGAAKVRLAPDGDGTMLSYEVDAKVGGKLAQLGSRIIDGFARKMAESFFARFQEAVEGPEAGDAPAAQDEGAAATEAPKKGWFKRILGKA